MTSLRSTTTTPGAQTRARIMEALVDVLSTDGISEFSVQAVADRANVSHRTVYRHYPSREALLEGLTEHLEDPMRASGLPGIPASLDQAVDSIVPLFEFFEKHAPTLEAMVVVRLALGVEPARSQERTGAFRELVEQEAPDLPPDEADAYAMGLRAIASSQHWYVLTRRLGITTPRAADVAAQSLRALIGQIRRRNARERSKEET